MQPNDPPQHRVHTQRQRVILWTVGLLILVAAGLMMSGGVCPLKRDVTQTPPPVPHRPPPVAAKTDDGQCTSHTVGSDLFVRCRYFFDDGTFRGESSYKNGRPHGEFQVFFYKGRLRQEHAYEDGRRVGSYRRYFPDGGLAQQYDYIPGTTRKVAQYFYPDGKLLGREELEENRFEGPSVFYSPAGDVISELTAQANTFYDADGEPVQGERIFRYPNGQILLRESYVDGRMHGARELYRADGAPIWKYPFRNGLAEGVATEHYQDGAVRANKYYRNHKLYKEEEFDPKGRLVFSGQYAEPEALLPDTDSGIQGGAFAR